MWKLKDEGGCKLSLYPLRKNRERVVVGKGPLPPYCSEDSKIGTLPHTCSLWGTQSPPQQLKAIVASGPSHSPCLVSLVFELYLLLPTDTWLARALEWTWLDSAASLGCSTVIQKNEMILWVTHHGDREQWGCKHDCPGECHTSKKKAALFVPWCISCKSAGRFLFYKAWQLRSSSVTYAVLEWTYTPSLSSLWNECTLHFRFKS